ncbi:hypothetical protein [Clostridium sporogenes]|uniref:hypothetical protein n=1 Tax=Clostridium sporogenes TaxID=1509 RepID=UPI0001794D3C|nr:hypothetical protein [Clostridium sporogenes]EDU35720.1 hypothetical protein CLOSPO_01885 [Clostridium sporogenes ATCC 15579]NFE66646.1 hypothetical protein [Clostridium sporogenes]
MKNEQLSFLKPIEKNVGKQKIYDATICDRCCCNKCKYSVEIYPFLSTEECKEIEENSCFNCDECYYYGMDDNNLSGNKVKFKCDKFEMSNHYVELEAKIKRKNFKII